MVNVTLACSQTGAGTTSRGMQWPYSDLNNVNDNNKYSFSKLHSSYLKHTLAAFQSYLRNMFNLAPPAIAPDHALISCA